ncbi:chaperonin 10-like protein [Diaporthe sp. PMI_573]|nr:chaperonin 10-like protein [Diaporthaceae sp. PMI_573]
MASNQAAWLDGKDVRPLAIRAADMPEPGPYEVVVKNHAVAINPLDWKMQDSGSYVGTFPTIIGTDIAGEIYALGSEVKGFKKGDRVLAHCTGIMDHKPQSGAFQLYTATHSALTSKVPTDMSFVDAAVLPLAVSTAAKGLYAKDYLALQAPSASPTQRSSSSSSKGLAILVWGGSSSVGAATIQLAKASGVPVLATASARNLDVLRSELGADHVFDYKSDSVVADIVLTVKDLHPSSGVEFVGIYDAITDLQTFKEALLPILDGLKSDGLISVKKLALVLYPPPDLPDDVQAKAVFAGMLLPGHGYDDVTRVIWETFVPEALSAGILTPFLFWSIPS